ncbi:methylmalonyl-CoA epimerase [Chloroflexota bacterium]
MLIGLSHIGIAVKNLEEALKVYVNVLGAQTGQIHRWPKTGLGAVMLTLGNSKIELMEPIGTEGPLAKFIENRGEGIHHICIEVDNIDKTLESLSAQGVWLIDNEARQGLEGKIAFIHPKAMNGVLVELVEKEPSSTSSGV